MYNIEVSPELADFNINGKTYQTIKNAKLCIKGLSHGRAYPNDPTNFANLLNENYAITNNDDKIEFGGTYINIPTDENDTSASTHKFPVIAANGIYSGAKEVIVTYNNRENDLAERNILITF